MQQRLLQCSREDDTFVVGGCRGGDCLAATYLMEAGFKVHTVLPSIQAQLCGHWKRFLAGDADSVHTTTSEQMPETSIEPYRRRNERMVSLGRDLLLAFPWRWEQEAHSGVTMTINIARRQQRVPVEVISLHPEPSGVMV